MIFSGGRIDKMSDGELLDHYLRTGRLDYFGELYNRYMPLVYGLCLKYLRRVEAAEDAVMQIFEDLAPKVGRYDIKEFRTWIYTVARNHCLQKLRGAGKEIPLDFAPAVMESENVLHLLTKKEEDEKRYGVLEDCIERLPGPQKESIRLFFMEEKSYADIADITKYAVKSVKSYIQNAKRNLKICMEKRGEGQG